MSALFKPMRIFIVAVMIFVTANVAKAEDAVQVDSAKDAVLQAVHTWLQLVDREKYSESWEGASAYFKAAVTQEDWTHSLSAVRKPLGNTLMRKLTVSEFLTELPGAPDGNYLVVLYETVFQNKQHAVETVTFMQEADGHWRVSGYFIK
ncbi:MAG: DUF4019 domain-containing protein [Pseudomonadota bacterium]|nr:DUF4019 domain-containing protein [Pseudomonadota bacterium]QKK05677.1 MAG: DUF4019 domain-containing protein [Pseudomonadota bacterium]